ncbi:hypothetical protein MGG_08377 [Pyricularia oryzae 70-15]|uniref:O-methyltransferase OME1 n=4 Tax=Pyricularia oryzae TaxID=318829 RepID=OME1B_PYRO7|nr:uncharacterized protein MGG_08377 [Pyricularia oryzae 70-15]G4MWB6.1 RecName: Full=O-methyltransferase OME1; AltName: Full=ACE1 cytochalasan biosynthesis cluster protein OME1 [Pyricularia oryzae 70-15]EHA55876.1 hypothetical protein MGG_08377 [Pyricularia oryzae 70-15]KAI7908806.1 hypothetical protein M0657_012126 [Pyricularia oryzae]KAI7910296.1 hypothetical protein M9X92_011188 [Pyricularia oryzae]
MSTMALHRTASTKSDTTMACPNGLVKNLPLGGNTKCSACGSHRAEKRRASSTSSVSTTPTSPSFSEADWSPLHNSSQEPQPEYTKVANSLMRAITDYVGHLQNENLPMPSLEPAADAHGVLKHPEGVAARNAVVELAQRIVAMTMDPDMNLLISSLQFHFCSSLKVAIDLKVHEHVPRRGSITSSELAAKVGADESILVRIMRALILKHVFCSPTPGTYAHTAMSWCMMKSPDAIDLLGHRLDESFRASSRQADALALVNYREPDEADVKGFSMAFGTTENFWEVLGHEGEEERAQRFNRAMRAVSLNTLDVIPRMYPFDRIRGDGLLVDVGGGLGQVARAIMGAHRGAGLRSCIVQDAHAGDDAKKQPDVMEANRKLGVELQKHNFFDPQPVKGASVYFLRHIFHDWPDRACVKILKQTVEAMGKDSTLLICDQVVDDEASPQATLYDIDMWSLFGGKERNRSEWEALFRSADERLYIKKVWTTAEAPTTMLEVCLS